MDGAFRTARVAFVSPAPITGSGVHVVAAAQLLQRFRITHKTTLPLQPASSPVFLVNVGHSCDSDAWHSMCQCHTLVVTGNLSCSCRRDQWRCLMNQVMRRSVCCLLSTLLLWSCVGCTKAVHEVPVMAPYRAVARMMMPQNRHIKHLLWTLWTVSPSMISITRTNWF